MTDQFYTPYERQNHTNIVKPTGPERLDYEAHLSNFSSRMWRVFWANKQKQKVVRRYVINADYEYKPELKEVRNECGS